MPAACPPDDDLAAYGLGKLATPALTTVAAHIATCQECVRKLAGLTADSFVTRLKDAKTADGTGWPGKSLSGLSRNIPEPTPVPAHRLPVELVDHPHYTDVRELGRGGMGVVYLALHRLMNRRVALKVVGSQFLGRPETRERFLREVRAAGQLKHQYVVTAYDAVEVGESILFVMEYIPGEDLGKVVKASGPLPVPQACSYTAMAALGLQHAHEKGMVHRDIKPGNLMLDRSGKKAVVKVTDFGLAKAAGERMPDANLTGSGQMMGTPAYMAPEQWRDAARADIRADVYSLGCTLYHLLTGHAPFQASMPELYGLHRDAVPLPLNQVRPDVPADLGGVVARMLEKDPARRYQTPGEVAAALKPFIRPAAPQPAPRVPAAAETIPPPSTRTMAPASPLPLPGAESRTVRKRRRVWPALAAVGVVLLGLLAAWAGGLFVQTKDGVIELTGLTEDADVFVDGEKVTVSWDGGKQKAEVRAKPGTRTVEVRRGDVRVSGETVQVESGGRTVLTAKMKPEGETWVPLFGDDDLTPWRVEGGDAASWKLKDGVLTAHKPHADRDPDVRHFLLSPQRYGDFGLRFEYLIEAEADGGVVFRAVDDEKLPVNNKPASTHPLMKILDRKRWGSIAEFGQLHWVVNGSWKRPKEIPDPAIGEWHRVEVSVLGERCVVRVDGKQLWDEALDADESTHAGIVPALKRRSGRIGFQLNSGALQIRNAEVTARPEVKKDDGFVQLFNGKDLTGWTKSVGHTGGEARVNEEGHLILNGGGGVEVGNWDNLLLESTQIYSDFHLRLRVKTHDRHGEVYIRSAMTRTKMSGCGVILTRIPGQLLFGYEVPPGTVCEVVDLKYGPREYPWTADVVDLPADGWYTIEVIARGRTIKTLVEGEQVAKVSECDPALLSGRIVLHTGPKGTLTISEVAIKELK